MSYYTAEELQQVQSVIDKSDPYLLEVLSEKTEQEILDYLERLMKELDRIPSENMERIRRQQSAIDTTRAVYQSIQMNKGEPNGGLVIL